MSRDIYRRFERATTVVIPVGDRTLTSGQCATIIGVAPRTVCKWIDMGHLPSHLLPQTGQDKNRPRRVYVSDLVAFMRANGMRVPAELLAGANVAFGLASGEAVSGFAPVSLIEVGALLASGRVGAGVFGDAAGLSNAVEAARAVRAACPGARLALVLDPATAEFVPPPGAFDLVRVRPCDLAAVARELIGETPDGAP